MEPGDSDCDYPLKELEQAAQGEHDEDNKGNEDNNASDETEICQTLIQAGRLKANPALQKPPL